MNREDFVPQMNRLMTTFGKAHYPSERLDLIWKEVGSLESADFNRIVDYLISELRQAPLLPEIREQAARARERAWNRQKKERFAPVVPIRSVCSRCYDSGVVLARLKTDRSAFAFKCSCSNGRADRRNYPVWTVSDEEMFEAV